MRNSFKGASDTENKNKISLTDSRTGKKLYFETFNDSAYFLDHADNPECYY